MTYYNPSQFENREPRSRIYSNTQSQMGSILEQDPSYQRFQIAAKLK